MADLIVRKVGEGVEKPNAEQELPLDINYQRLVDWLVIRQKLAKDWNKRLQAIQSKSTEALKAAPTFVEKDAPLDYWRCCEIRDALAAKSDRTLFGGLTGQAAVWDKITKAYENSGVFLGEAAQNMIQNVDYEIPYLRKQGNRFDQQVAENERKAAEYKRSAGQCASNYRQECMKLGVESVGGVLRSELKALSRQLPPLMLALVHELKSADLKSARSFYQAFSEHAHGDASCKELLITLSEVQKSCVQKFGVERIQDIQTSTATGDPTSISIDWGVQAEVGPDDIVTPPAAISWGLEGALDVFTMQLPTPENAAVVAGISWDIDIEAQPSNTLEEAEVAVDGGVEGVAVSCSDNGAEVTVDWGIDLTDTGIAEGGSPVAAVNWDIDTTLNDETGGAVIAAGTAAAPSIDWGILEPTSGAAEAAAAPDFSSQDGEQTGHQDEVAASRLEYDAEYRGRLIEDLHELRAFLLQRVFEMNTGGVDLLSALLPPSVQAIDLDQAKRLLQFVDSALKTATSGKLRQLLMIKTSQRYFERLVLGLERKSGQESKLLTAAKEAEDRRREAQASLSALSPRLIELVARTRAIKEKTEAALAAAFGGRRVNILGDINSVLSSTGL
ncbi:hypothetical protein CEUSTIGMA_g3703.t1 [Chlamydomonas eustigma]|uniref:CDK5RAP3-like protein n=1 Tax=Chlamydomonas eustigma TaxID=1157962 RepID=A0A250WZY9_9CHLO|nr:hypothetical protein CEUSTIGMA_g3703.t1 [Chlamydomonas eustigma]|eukprot:GAX76259.1 hypothetical protein CEUSTIGMA_g3703.t1 [Chlamydomonas eustigma]